MEICEAVTEKKQDAGKVRFKVLPEIPAAACIFHKGSYDTLHRSYAVLLQYIEENGYETAGISGSLILTACGTRTVTQSG